MSMERSYNNGKIALMKHQIGFLWGYRKTIQLVTYSYKISISQKLQITIVKFHHKYLLHPTLNKIETTIFQHLYWHKIIYSVQNKVINHGTNIKRSNINIVNSQLS